MDLSALEQELAVELRTPPGETRDGGRRAVRREMVLPTLSQSAQFAEDFQGLVQEAGNLAATALGASKFGFAETRDERLGVSLGSVGSKGFLSNNLVAADSQRSIFQFAMDNETAVLMTDASKELRFRDPMLVENSVQSGVVCPIQYRGQLHGAIGVFADEPREFSKEDVLFLHSVASYLGPATAHLKSEQSLVEHSQFVSSAMDALDALVVLLTADGSIVQINRTCQNLGGFTAVELRGRNLCGAFCQPDESGMVESALADLRGGKNQIKRDLFFLTKPGTVRRIHWTFARIREPSASAPSILATGVDVTEQYKLTQKSDSATTTAMAAQVPSPAGLPKLSEKRPEPSDGRKHDRRPYQCIQLVAPCFNGKIPEMSDFREVRCYDISPGGFAFLLATRPVFEELVAAFGASNSRLFLRARIKHVTPIEFEGRKVLKIGCQYLGRVRKPQS